MFVLEKGVDLWALLCCSGWGYCSLFLLFLVGALKKVFVPMRDLKSARYLEPLKTPVSTRKSFLLALAMTAISAITFLTIAIIMRNTEMMQAYRNGLSNKAYYVRENLLQNISWFLAIAQMTIAGWGMWILNIKKNRSQKTNILCASYHKVFVVLALFNLVAGAVSAVLSGVKQGYSRYAVYIMLIQLFTAFMIFQKEKLHNGNILRSMAVGAFGAIASRNTFSAMLMSAKHYPYEGPARFLLAAVSSLICVILVLRFMTKAERINKSMLFWNAFLLLISFCITGNTICNVTDELFDMNLTYFL